MSEFEAKAQTVRRLLPLLDARDLAVVVGDVAELTQRVDPLVGDVVRHTAELLFEVFMRTRNQPLAPAEHSPSCSDVEPCS